MRISGKQARKIYKQDNGFSWVADFFGGHEIPDFSFGFSGSSHVRKWRVVDKKLYKDNNFIYSFSNDLRLSGNILPDREDLFVNQLDPIYLGYSEIGSGYDNIFFDISPDKHLDLNFFVYSNNPDHNYSLSDDFHSGEQVEISFENNSPNQIIIFSGKTSSINFDYSSENNYLINPGDTGVIFLNPNTTSPSSSFDVSLFTNFGNIVFPFSANYLATPSNPFFLSFGPRINPASDSVYNANIVYYNRSGADLSISFEYVAGTTGDYYGFITHENSMSDMDVSGFISGEGFLTGYYTGEITRFNDLNNQVEAGTGSGLAREFRFAQGVASGDFVERIFTSGRGLVDAMIIGSGWSQPVPFSGKISRFKRYIDVPDLIATGTGYYFAGLDFDQEDPLSTDFEVWEKATGLISGTGRVFPDYDYDSIPIKINLNSDQYETRGFSSDVFFGTGKVSFLADLFGAAFATGGEISGKILGDFAKYYEPGFWTFSRYSEGSGSGIFPPISGFDPAAVEFNIPKDPIESLVFGYLQGVIGTGISMDNCDFELPDMLLTGIPDVYYRSGGQPTVPYEVIRVMPNNFMSEYLLTDTLDFQKESGSFVGTIPLGEDMNATGYHDLNIIGEYFDGQDYSMTTPSGGRIRISRPGATPSGSGSFSHLFVTPFFMGDRVNPTGEDGKEIESEGTGISPGANMWKESFGTYDFFGYLSGKDPDLKDIFVETFFDSDMDSVISEVEITGDDFTDIRFDLELTGYRNKTICLNVFKSGDYCISGAPNFSSQYNTYFNPVLVHSYKGGHISTGEMGDDFNSDKYNVICNGPGCLGTGDYSGKFTSIDSYLEDDFSDFIVSGDITGNVFSTGVFIRSAKWNYLMSGTLFRNFPTFSSNERIRGFSHPQRSVSWSGIINFNNPLIRNFNYNCYGPGCTSLGQYEGLCSYTSGASRIFRSYFGNCLNRNDSLNIFSGTYFEAYHRAEIVNESFWGDHSQPISRYIDNAPPPFGHDFNFNGFYFNHNASQIYSFSSGTLGRYVTGECFGSCLEGQAGDYSGWIRVDSTGLPWSQNLGNHIKSGSFSGNSRFFGFKNGESSGNIHTRACNLFSGVSEKIDEYCADCMDYNDRDKTHPEMFLSYSSFSRPYQVSSGIYSFNTFFKNCERVPSVEDPHSFGFSHYEYIGCENDEQVDIRIVKEGKFAASGVLTLARAALGSNSLPAYEVGGQGYGTVIPFFMSRDTNSLNIPFRLENEGEMERDEYFWVNLINVGFEGNKVPVSFDNDRRRAMITVKDDDFDLTFSCSPTIPPQRYGCCSHEVVDYESDESGETYKRVCFTTSPPNCQNSNPALINPVFKPFPHYCIDGVNCVREDRGPNPVIGPCCIPRQGGCATDCLILERSACVSIGGTFQNSASSCSEALCSNCPGVNVAVLCYGPAMPEDASARVTISSNAGIVLKQQTLPCSQNSYEIISETLPLYSTYRVASKDLNYENDPNIDLNIVGNSNNVSVTSRSYKTNVLITQYYG